MLKTHSAYRLVLHRRKNQQLCLVDICYSKSSLNGATNKANKDPCSDSNMEVLNIGLRNKMWKRWNSSNPDVCNYAKLRRSNHAIMYLPASS